ncbi:MAG: hypothetical protein IKT25_09095 [Firmicutes bacterium]|nr:hypothetical protein [Bacillota bacterium]
MDYVKYSRAVIVLEEKDREFADKPGTEMKGYLRVETGNNRGAIRCVIQNIKYYPRSEYTYQLILFGKRKEKTIHRILGTIPVSRYGAGEVYLRFHPQDVDGEGNDYGCYTTAIVAAVSAKNRREPLHPVLVGQTGHEAAGAAALSLESERGLPQEVGRKIRRTYNQYYADHIKHVCEYFWGMRRDDLHADPFDRDDDDAAEELTEAKWIRIDDPTAMFLVSPGGRYFAERCGYFLLGKREEIYYVAVPGRNCSEDQPDGGESGFQRWKAGYWIAAIDGANGEIFSMVDR